MCQTGERFLEPILQENSNLLHHGGYAEKEEAYGWLPDSLGGFICIMLRVALQLGYPETIFVLSHDWVQEWCKGEELVRALAQPSGACRKVPSEW